ncbi:MAG: nickel-dependent hydrogenase large subunit [Planctomycetota bacterium]|nr:nickel-dependent hydrogenase large subunit [Planctomycetota bacterium]
MHGSHPHTHDENGDVISIDPVTRIEGHMKVEAVVDGGEVKEARCCGTLFRGFENILIGRHPLDAVRLTQRVCGVCPTAHGTASALCLDDALGVADKIPHNGRLVRNLLLGSNYLQSHILHFFALAALDFVDVTALADYAGSDSELKAVRAFIDRQELSPFFPRYEGDYRCEKQTNVALVKGYLAALHVRRVCHEMLSIFGGKMPHNIGIVPGGVTGEVTADKIASFAGKLEEIGEFVEDVYIPAIFTVAGAYGDYFDIGAGCKRFLSYGVFDMDGERLLPPGLIEADGKPAKVDAARITEDVASSRYSDECAARPAEGKTIPQPDKQGAYTWLKAPRYDGGPAEVGPLARAIIGFTAGNKVIKGEVESALSAAGVGAEKLPSVLGRHLARALECRIAVGAMTKWLDELQPGEPVAVPLEIPDQAAGMGLSGAPRGALGHWIEIKDKVISRYQLVVPTTWNGSPKDSAGLPGPIEQALIGTKIRDRDNPFEIVRIIRSFDPCLACSVHVLTAAGRAKGVYRIV